MRPAARRRVTYGFFTAVACAFVPPFADFPLRAHVGSLFVLDSNLPDASALGVAFFAARWIQPLLFHESATDPFIYGGVGVLIVVVALIASAVPAVRATRVDPNTALRSD